jgi:hypothetical protein
MQVRFLLATTAATATVSLLPLSAQAAILFSTTGITVTQPTTVRFTLVSAGQPNQFFTSNLFVYVINPTSGYVDFSSASPLFLRNPPSGSPSPIGSFQDFTFLPNFTYTLGLTNYNPSNLNSPSPYSPFVFSTNQSNSTQNGLPANIPNTTDPNPNLGQQRVIFGYNGPLPNNQAFSNASNFASLSNPTGSFLISFEDGGIDPASGVFTPDRDFNDFQITAQVIPAPPLLMGLLALGARVFFRQRKSVRT